MKQKKVKMSQEELRERIKENNKRYEELVERRMATLSGIAEKPLSEKRFAYLEQKIALHGAELRRRANISTKGEAVLCIKCWGIYTMTSRYDKLEECWRHEGKHAINPEMMTGVDYSRPQKQKLKKRRDQSRKLPTSKDMGIMEVAFN